METKWWKCGGFDVAFLQAHLVAKVLGLCNRGFRHTNVSVKKLCCVLNLDSLKPFNQFLSFLKNEIDVYQNIGQHHVTRVDICENTLVS